MPTPLRNIRIPDELWFAALDKAERDDDTLSNVIRKLLTKYVAG
jgi:predicted CopG family antitoxin